MVPGVSSLWWLIELLSLFTRRPTDFSQLQWCDDCLIIHRKYRQQWHLLLTNFFMLIERIYNEVRSVATHLTIWKLKQRITAEMIWTSSSKSRTSVLTNTLLLRLPSNLSTLKDKLSGCYNTPFRKEFVPSVSQPQHNHWHEQPISALPK